MPLMLIMFSLIHAAVPGSAALKRRQAPEMPNLPSCTFVIPAREVKSLDDLPEQVRTEVVGYFKGGGGLADAGGEFDNTDVIIDKTVPRQRFLRAYLTNDVWFVWWQGPIGGNLYTLALTRQREKGASSSVFRVAHGSGFTGDLCAGSKAFLTGARAASAI